MTAHSGRVICILEKRLGRPLQGSVNLLHCNELFGKISVIVQIKLVKTEKIKAISVNRLKYCKYLAKYANNNYKRTTGVTVLRLTDIKLIKVVFICVEVTKE